jgi:hypothetical protein
MKQKREREGEKRKGNESDAVSGGESKEGAEERTRKRKRHGKWKS